MWSENTTMLNSVVVAPGVDGTAIRTEADAATATATYRNMTAIAPESGGVAIRARATGPAGFANVLARNVIARGGSAGFEAYTDNSGATATITVDHSNWLGGSKIGTKATIVDGGGVSKGADRTFTTTATPPSPTSTTQAPAALAFAGVKPVSTKLTFGGRLVTLKLRCPAATVGRCAGRTRLTSRSVTLGLAPFSIPAGTRATVKIRISRAGRGLLGHARRNRGKASNAARDGAGTRKRTVAAVTIRGLRR